MQAQAQELRPIPVKPDVWSLVGMDLIGPLTKSSSGNQYILTMTCYFSKWVEAFPLPDKSAVAKGIYSAYCRHGAPDEITSDQGREFLNQVLLVITTVYYYFDHSYVHLFLLRLMTLIFKLIRGL